MSNRTPRPTGTRVRTARSTTRTPASRGAGARRTTAQRRGIAGGWLQRRQPEPSRANKALASVRRALPGSKGASAAAAAGLALVGAAGVALRRRGRHDEPAYQPPATPVAEPTPASSTGTGAPSMPVAGPESTLRADTPASEPPSPPAAA